ncbi:MAG TPA: hypothetical protein VFT54_08790, partial [Acidimicrobiia bacterium]|nr:hypothetical protein [Acidimicrobiia bacterium]
MTLVKGGTLTAPHGKWLFIFLVLTMALAAVPAFGLESGVVGLASDPSKPHIDDWVIVKLRPGMAAAALNEGAQAVFDRWIRVPVPPEVSAIEWARALAQRPGVEIAELDMKMELLSSPPLVSNDPFFLSGDQWNLERVQAPQAWLIATGTGIKVAILDGGVSVDPNPTTRDGFCRAFVDE